MFKILVSTYEENDSIQTYYLDERPDINLNMGGFVSIGGTISGSERNLFLDSSLVKSIEISEQEAERE